MTRALKKPRPTVHFVKSLYRPLSTTDILAITFGRHEMTLDTNGMLTRDGQSCFIKYATIDYGITHPMPKK
jgi:hypothetical protein